MLSVSKQSKILAVYPTKNRAQAAYLRLKEFAQTGGHNVDYVVNIDNTDTESIAVFDSCRSWATVNRIEPRGKVYAINAGISEKIDDYLGVLVLSDDMKPMQDYWADTLIELLTLHYPDTDGVLWLNDGYRGKGTQYPLMTVCLMGREYYNRFGYFYAPCYKSLFCDDEQMMVAGRLGRRVYIPELIIKHEHPASTGEVWDELLKYNESFYHDDQLVFEKRRREIMRGTIKYI